MTREELLNKAINWFKIIAKDMSRITSGNLSHNTKTTQGRAIRAYEFVEKYKNECFDEWHKESEESIYNSITDWNIHRFACLMNDDTIQVFSGIQDENHDGEIATHIDNADDYDTDDIVMWTEIPKLNDKL